MKLLFVGSSDFVLRRGLNGSSQDLDLLQFLHKETNNTLNFDSKLVFTNDVSYSSVSSYMPDIVYLYDCDKPRPHFNPIIDACNDLKIPVILISNDIFYTELVKSEPNTNRIQGILSMVNMEKVLNQYRKWYPDKIISYLPRIYIDTDVYKDWGLSKKYDITIFGTLEFYHQHHELPLNNEDADYLERWKIRNNQTEYPSEINFYPLRKRIADLLLQHQDKYRINYIPKPQQGCWNCPVKREALSKLLNQSRLCLATTSRTNRCMFKYFEISASACGILGNIPTDYQSFRYNAVEIDEDMTDEQILAKIDEALSRHSLIDFYSRQRAKTIDRLYGNGGREEIINLFLKKTQDIISELSSKNGNSSMI